MTYRLKNGEEIRNVGAHAWREVLAMKRRQKIPVDRARDLYDRLGKWRLVANVLRFQTGRRFQPEAIFKVVRQADRSG